MNPLSIKLKQEQIKLVSVSSQCSQKDFVEKSGYNKALHLVSLPFPIFGMMVSKHYQDKDSVILE